MTGRRGLVLSQRVPLSVVLILSFQAGCQALTTLNLSSWTPGLETHAFYREYSQLTVFVFSLGVGINLTHDDTMEEFVEAKVEVEDEWRDRVKFTCLLVTQQMNSFLFPSSESGMEWIMLTDLFTKLTWVSWHYLGFHELPLQGVTRYWQGKCKHWYHRYLYFPTLFFSFEMWLK